MRTKEILENKYIHIAILAVLAIVIYSISWRYEMYSCLDDGPYVLHNEHLGFSLQNIKRWLTQPCIGLFVPVTMFSFMFDYNIWGLDSLGYHLQNTFWFIITIIAIYSCFVKLKLKPWHAFVLVLIYAVHPQRVESVVWITERKDVLSGALFFTALFFYLYKFDKDKFNFLTFFLYIIALFCKPMAVTLPVVLVMIDFSRKRQLSPKYYIKKFWPYALVIIAYLIIIASLRTDFIKTQTDNKRMLSVMLFNIYWYIKSVFIPDFCNMSVLYPKLVFTWQIITQMLIFYLLLIGTGVICFFKAKKETLLYSVLPLIVCYIAVLSPVLGGFSFSSSNYADRYNYIPSVFLLFAIGCVAPLIINSRTKRIITLFLVTYIMILTYSTIMYLPHWKNSYSVYAKSCNHQPANIYSVLTLGLIEAKSGNYEKAVILAKRLRNDYRNSSHDIRLMAQAGELYTQTLILFKIGQKERALKILCCLAGNKAFRNIICELHEGETFYSMLADCYLKKRMVKKAVLCFKRIVEMQDVAEQNIFFYKGMIALIQNKKQEAADYFEKAWRLAPEDKNIKYNLMRVRESLKQQNK
jgi:protein O-mannosyl-transferase